MSPAPSMPGVTWNRNDSSLKVAKLMVPGVKPPTEEPGRTRCNRPETQQDRLDEDRTEDLPVRIRW
jgi:hypothetical protein